MKTLKDFPEMVERLGGYQNTVDELYAMARTYTEFGYSSKIIAAFYGIDTKAPSFWDGICTNGHHISKKQYLYLRSNNINPNGLDSAGASAILGFIYMNGGIHRRLKANKFYKELMDLLPKERIPEYPKDIDALEMHFATKTIKAVEDPIQVNV